MEPEQAGGADEEIHVEYGHNTDPQVIWGDQRTRTRGMKRFDKAKFLLKMGGKIVETHRQNKAEKNQAFFQDLRSLPSFRHVDSMLSVDGRRALEGRPDAA